MNKLFGGLLAALVIGSCWSACTDPTTIGSELLELDEAKVGFVDTLSLSSSTTTGDSIRTYSPLVNNQLTTYLLGNMEDPVFGSVDASIYAELRLRRTSSGFDFLRPVIGESPSFDSLILLLPIDTIGWYGITDTIFEIEVLEVVEDMDNSEEYFSNKTFATNMMPLATFSYRATTDTVWTTEYANGDTIAIVGFPHVRIPLNDSPLPALLLDSDTTKFDSDSTLLESLKGIQLRVKTPNPGMLSFDLQDNRGGLYIYFRDAEDAFQEYQFPINQFSTKVSNYTLNNEGATVAPFIDDDKLGDSLIFLQSMSGLITELQFDELEELQGRVINKAELIITINDNIEGDNTEFFEPISSLVAVTRNDDGNFIAIEDVALASAGFSNEVFGGRIEQEEGSDIRTYQMNITSHLQEVVSGAEPDNLFILANIRGGRASRSVLYGGKHPEFPIKLRVAYTEL